MLPPTPVRGGALTHTLARARGVDRAPPLTRSPCAGKGAPPTHTLARAQVDRNLHTVWKSFQADTADAIESVECSGQAGPVYCLTREPEQWYVPAFYDDQLIIFSCGQPEVEFVRDIMYVDLFDTENPTRPWSGLSFFWTGSGTFIVMWNTLLVRGRLTGTDIQLESPVTTRLSPLDIWLNAHVPDPLWPNKRQWYGVGDSAMVNDRRHGTVTSGAVRMRVTHDGDELTLTVQQ